MQSSDNYLFLCPITHQIMYNPYIDNEGNTYEYSAIIEWLSRNNTSPITRNYLDITHLKPNRCILDIINNLNNSQNINNNNSQNINNNNNNENENDNIFKIEDIIINLNISKNIDNEYSYFKINICPIEGNDYPPLDIVAVIDVSYSMSSPAYIEQDGKKLDIGFTVLDITKHALQTIIESMKPCDKLSIITFSNDAKVICNLTNINNTNKSYIKNQISNLKVEGATNMWSGLNTGLQQFENNNDYIKDKDRSSVLLFLTDGIPSEHLSPPRGIIHRLNRKLLSFNNNSIKLPNIYTFGFGYSLDTDLLVNIAKIGNGNFSFIPDSGFVGTIFIHALANIGTIIANNCIINLDYTCNEFKNKSECIGYDINNINISTINYGSSKTILFKILNKDLEKCSDLICIALKYKTLSSYDRLFQTTFNKNMNIDDNNDKLNDNIIRLELVKTLSDNNFVNYYKYLEKYKNSNNDIILDFKEQIILAIDNNFYNKWGKNYINSFKDAHQQERCNNFKDKSIQKYGGKLFNNLKEKFDDIYTNMPPPIPSNNNSNNDITSSTDKKITSKVFSQSFNNVNGGCFHENSKILMADKTYKYLSELVKNDKLYDMNGNLSTVICLIKMKCPDNKCNMVRLKEGTIITPYHPVFINNEWVFPYTQGELNTYNCSYIYNLVLDNNHNVIIDNNICVTFGHNFTNNFVVSHQYFGSNNVINDLKNMNGYENGLIYLEGNYIIRDNISNRIIGMKQ